MSRSPKLLLTGLSFLLSAGAGAEPGATAAVQDNGSSGAAAPAAAIFALGSQVTCRSGPDPACAGARVFQVPTDLSALHKARALTFGLRHGCLLDDGGGAQCWGDALDGQLGVDPEAVTERHLGRPARAAPGPVAATTRFAAISAGWLHTCALDGTGAVTCWGDNARNQLGRTGASPEPGSIEGLQGVLSLAAGGLHTCARDTEGRAWCWGDGSFGQLGDGKGADSAQPVPVTGLAAPVTFLASGAYHSCALEAGGTVRCWGLNRLGQLGDGTYDKRLAPVAVNGLTGKVHSLAAGAAFTCALLADGSVQCWGSNEFGELGNGASGRSADKLVTAASAGPPVQSIPQKAVALHAAELHACALVASGEAYCWGANDSGQLGDGTVGLQPLPVRWQDLQAALPRPVVADPTPPVDGIDVSYHSGYVGWDAARADGYRFGFTLATAGVDFRDPFLAAHWEHMRQVGLLRGAYHYFVPGDDAARQARHFLSHVVYEPGDLLPVVDIESAATVPPADLAAQLAEFSNEIENALGVVPIIYTSPNFWQEHVEGPHPFGDHPLWISHYGVPQPRIPPGWQQWQLWQWKPDAGLPHISPVVDLDRAWPDVDVRKLRIPGREDPSSG